MSRRCSLTTQTGKIWLVIRKNKPIDKVKIQAYLNSVAEDYAFIEHTADIEPVTGLVEGVHYHIWYNAKNKRQQLVKILNDWCDYLGFNNSDGVVIERYSSPELCIQYLIHKNNPEKTPHNIKEIITNIDSELLKTYIACDTSIITFDYIYSLCNSSSNILEVIKAIGIANYQRYRATITDIFFEVKKNRLIGEVFKGEIVKS